jgi:hypothetical protein
MVDIEKSKTDNVDLNAILAEIRSSRDELKKEVQKSRIAMWLTPAAFGGSIAIFGMSYLARLTVDTWGIWTTAIPIVIVGIAFMIFAQKRASKAQREFKDKWNELPKI